MNILNCRKKLSTSFWAAFRSTTCFCNSNLFCSGHFRSADAPPPNLLFCSVPLRSVLSLSLTCFPLFSLSSWCSCIGKGCLQSHQCSDNFWQRPSDLPIVLEEEPAQDSHPQGNSSTWGYIKDHQGESNSGHKWFTKECFHPPISFKNQDVRTVEIPCFVKGSTHKSPTQHFFVGSAPCRWTPGMALYHWCNYHKSIWVKSHLHPDWASDKLVRLLSQWGPSPNTPAELASHVGYVSHMISSRLSLVLEGNCAFKTNTPPESKQAHDI